MAANIEAQVWEKLRSFESLITAAHSAASASAEVTVTEMSGTYAVYYLTERLTIEFESLHDLLAKQVLPLVADLKISAVRYV